MPENGVGSCEHFFRDNLGIWKDVNLKVAICFQYFVHANVTHDILEENLCDWRKFPFAKYEGRVDQIGDRELATGQAIQIYVDKKNFMKQELHGGRRYYTDYRKETTLLLTMHDKFVRHAEINLQNIAKKVKIYFKLLSMDHTY